MTSGNCQVCFQRPWQSIYTALTADALPVIRAVRGELWKSLWQPGGSIRCQGISDLIRNRSILLAKKGMGVCKRRRCEIYTGLCWSILRKNLKKLRRRDGNETCPFQTNCWVSCYLFIGGNVIQTLHLWIQIGVLVHIHYMYVLCLKICWFVTTEFYLLYTFRLPISCTTIGRFIWKFLVLIINIQKNILYDLENEKNIIHVNSWVLYWS